MPAAWLDREHAKSESKTDVNGKPTADPGLVPYHIWAVGGLRGWVAKCGGLPGEHDKRLRIRNSAAPLARAIPARAARIRSFNSEQNIGCGVVEQCPETYLYSCEQCEPLCMAKRAIMSNLSNEVRW